MVSFFSVGQTIGSVKTEDYKADFEKKQSIEVVSNYTGDIVIPIQVLKIGINEAVKYITELYESHNFEYKEIETWLRKNIV